MEAIIQRLRLQLFFPTSAFESRPNTPYFKPWQRTIDRFLREGKPPDPYSIDFDRFYPLDRSPLATLEGTESLLDQSGLRLLVRPDIQELSQIRGRFVLAR